MAEAPPPVPYQRGSFHRTLLARVSIYDEQRANSSRPQVWIEPTCPWVGARRSAFLMIHFISETRSGSLFGEP